MYRLSNNALYEHENSITISSTTLFLDIWHVKVLNLPLHYAGGYGDVGMAGWYIKTTVHDERKRANVRRRETYTGARCLAFRALDISFCGRMCALLFNSIEDLIRGFITTFSLIFESLVSSCMLAGVVQHQKLK